MTTSATQAVVQYTSPVAQACAIQVADMHRAITVASASQTNGQVTVQTAAPHGLLAGAVIYLENSGGWNGWQAVTSVPSSTSFVFASPAQGVPGGNVGVLVDDVNPALFPGSNLDSRPGSISTGQTASGPVTPLAQPAGRSRTLVIGKRAADIAADGNRYSRALQAYSRHHLTLTCGTQSFDQEFTTANIPLGDTYNEGPPADRTNPGQYSYPNIQWPNQAQTLIDPQTGIRSVRATAPAGTSSAVQPFTTAIDSQSAWQNASAPLANNGGAASFTAPCSSGSCPLFLRADKLSLYGGATYTTGYNGSSLDWVTVTINQASISGNCSGDDCKIVTCLTVNGVACASGNREASLSMTPANLTFGSGSLMDLWQNSGPPQISRVDATMASGTVNYNAATNTAALASGNPFNIKWTAGSQITIAGGQYTIASVQSELSLTLANGPTSNLSGVPYTANNFGVLIWKKTQTAATVSIGYATFLYGSTVMAPWSAQPMNNCSTAVTAGGVPGYNCFLDTELYWVAADGSDVRDLGMVQLWWYPDGRYGGWHCGQSGQLQQFDPQNGDMWYCMVDLYNQPQRWTILQAHYMGAHTRYTPGQQIPDCALNGGVQPCITYTIMQPNQSDSVNATAPGFNPDLAASGYQIDEFIQGGISNDGDMLIYALAYGGQDTPGWLFMYTLGDRTPTGTTANSFRIIAAAATYRKAPFSWCTIHSTDPPDGGWALFTGNAFGVKGANAAYSMTMTSPQLNTTSGMSACPPNPLNITGNNCVTINVTGPPANNGTGAVLQPLGVGDLMQIDYEDLKVVAIASPTQFIAVRGYDNTQIAAHASAALSMICGAVGLGGGADGLWNYRADPYGTNANWNTMVYDPQIFGGHHYLSGGVAVSTGGYAYNLGESVCPSSLLTTFGECMQVRQGTLYTETLAPVSGVTMDPPFAGKIGIGSGNEVDSHPGPCFNGWCTDARPLDGGDSHSLGSSSNPFTNVAGQLWKISGAQNVLNRKFLPTVAYAGRSALVDVSGPGSSIGTGAADAHKYCYAAVAGECYAGSAVGDVYVNTPFVSYPYCYYPGVAIYSDDTNSICIADNGAFTGNVVQFGVTQHDVTGAMTRRLGANFERWDQLDVFWNASAVPSGGLVTTQGRWLDGVRSDDLANVLPPFPSQDGVSRNTFYPLNVAIDPPPGLPVASAIVEFGYVENGGAASYYCTSRQETCVATGSGVNLAAPFYFEQIDTYSPAPCANGCTITIPALPEHVVYYRWKYLDASGQVIELSQARAALIP